MKNWWLFFSHVMHLLTFWFPWYPWILCKAQHDPEKKRDLYLFSIISGHAVGREILQRPRIGGGGGAVFLALYAISSISRKKNFGKKKSKF